MDETKPCKCGLPTKWASDPDHPVKYSEELKEYRLHDRAGRQWAMNFCFFCGAKFKPGSNDFWHEIDKKEESEVLALIEQIHNLEDMVRVLGEPDSVTEVAPRAPDIYGGSQKVRRWNRYFKRWRTICLNIGETSDGKPEITFHSKDKRGPA